MDDAFLTRGRAFLKSRMESRGTLRRKTGQKVKNSAGFESTEWSRVGSDIPFRSDTASSGDGGSRGITVGGVTYEEATGVGHWEWDRSDLRAEDLFEVTSGEWAGTVWRVIAVPRYDQKTARRLPIVEVPRPKEWTP